MSFRPVGSLWGRWDLHFHTPSSFDYSAKGTTNDHIVNGLKASGIVAVAITDHHRMDVARIKSLQALAGSDLTVFPGIELRSELGGKESVHLIGIFSERQDVDFIWQKVQGPLKITSAEVAQSGDDHVYVKFEDAAALIRELGGVVSVHAGRKTNSVENIGNDHPYKRAFKADLAKAHIDIFEIGKLADAEDYKTMVFPAIGVVKPMIRFRPRSGMKRSRQRSLRKRKSGELWRKSKRPIRYFWILIQNWMLRMRCIKGI
jgi:hypothetical protein